MTQCGELTTDAAGVAYKAARKRRPSHCLVRDIIVGRTMLLSDKLQRVTCHEYVPRTITQNISRCGNASQKNRDTVSGERSLCQEMLCIYRDNIDCAFRNSGIQDINSILLL